MNNKQKLHQIKLEQWAERFRRQASTTHLDESRDSRNTISITIDDIVIHAGSTVSDDHLLRILKAVRHA